MLELVTILQASLLIVLAHGKLGTPLGRPKEKVSLELRKGGGLTQTVRRLVQIA